MKQECSCLPKAPMGWKAVIPCCSSVLPCAGHVAVLPSFLESQVQKGETAALDFSPFLLQDARVFLEWLFVAFALQALLGEMLLPEQFYFLLPHWPFLWK